ncbi:MAG: hypothetical protein K0Q99_1995 [Clostridia bacterium]|jgi:predicted anti-sigma-YlaC factor YlaD|nr:hypothetical protein [Clostridia bacterium]
MSCRFDKDIIQKYADNTIEPLELIVLKEHIAVCQDCRFELELMNKLEDSIHDYFGALPNNQLLDEFSMKVLDKCYKGSKINHLKAGVSKIWKINKMVVSNASIYTSYLPGSKLAANTAKKAGKGINKALKSYVKNSFKKIIASL